MAGIAPFTAASAPVRTRVQRTGQATVTGLIVVVLFAGPIAAIWLLRGPVSVWPTWAWRCCSAW
jgi:hypothetical protein